MKILHINTERTWRGGEQQTLYLLRSLIKERRISCHLVCQAESPMAQKAREAGVEVFPIAMRGEVDLPASLRIRKLINRHGYDIVHSHTSHAHTLAFFASLWLQDMPAGYPPGGFFYFSQPVLAYKWNQVSLYGRLLHCHFA